MTPQEILQAARRQDHRKAQQAVLPAEADKGVGSSKAPPSPRQPLAPKNSLPQQSSYEQVSVTESARQDATPHQHSHHQRILQARLIAGGASLSTSSAHTPIPHKHISHFPSPLGATPRDDQARTSASHPPLAQTPRKRTAPFHEIQHDRLALRVHDTSSTESPHSNKRSRSSKTDSSLPNEHMSTSTGTGAGLVAHVDEAHLNDRQLSAQALLITGLPAPTSSQTDNATGSSVISSQTAFRAPVSGPPPRPKTKRIDKEPRLSAAERAKRQQEREADEAEWRRRFIKAFPSFRFHLDGFDATDRSEVVSIIEKLGASVDPFFSRTVTHLLTARRVSLPPAKHGNHTASVNVSSVSGMPTSSRSSQTISSRKKEAQVPIHSDRNPFEDSAPVVSSNDILVKARDFGIKVWTHDKFNGVIKKLIGEATTAAGDKQHLNLSQMLEKEKLQGSLDRDPTAARNDYYYFARNAVYLFVEDATAEHRPIMLQEWKKPATGSNGDEVPWPVLHGELEGRCPFTKYDFEGDPQKRAKPNRHETLRRTVSLNHARLRQQRIASLSPAPSGDSRGGYGVVRDASPYPLASGNSMSIASGVANTTSTAVGSATGAGGGTGLLSPFGPLGRQINQASGIGLGRPSAAPGGGISALRYAQLAGRQGSFHGVKAGDHMSGIAASRSLAMPFGAHARHVNLRSVSTPTDTEAVRREKKPGYCENCRVKYDDFDEHVSCRRHRKFAKEDANFAEIDDLIGRLSRPLAPWAAASASGSGAHTPTSTHETNLEGRDSAFDTSPSSSLIAAGGSLDEAFARELAQHQIDPEAGLTVEVATSQASLQSVKNTIASWQQDTADSFGDETFIDHGDLHGEEPEALRADAGRAAGAEEA